VANAKTYDFAFKILGGLDPKFASSFQDADRKIKQSNKTLKELQDSMQQLESAYKAGTISANSFATNSAKITAKINKESEALEELTKNQREYQEAQSALSGVGSNVKGLVAGATAGLGLGMVVSDISAYQQAIGQAKAMTGAMGEDWQNIESAIRAVYTSGFSTDMLDAAQIVGQVRQIMGDLGGDLQNVSRDAIVLRDTFDIDIVESTRAAKVMMEQFGITGEQAYTLIAQLAQKGANKNGDLADTINEYSVLFSQAGFSAEQMGSLYAIGTEKGIWSIDKMGDAIKEFNIRVKDGSKTTTEAFEAVGLDTDIMSHKFAKGGKSSQDAFKETIKALKAVEDPVKRNIAGVGFFGTMWEDLGEKAIFAMAETDNSLNMNANTLDDISKNKLNNASAAFAQLGRTIEVQFIAPLAEKATPVIQGVNEALSGIDPSVLVAAIAGVGSAIAAFSAASFIAGLGGIGAAASAAAVAIGAISWPVLAVAAIIGVLVAAGVYLISNWDSISATASEVYSNVVSYFTALKDGVINSINELVSSVLAKWEEFKSFLSSPIQGTVSIVKNVIGTDEPDGFATGGLIAKPTLAYFAEDGPEMAIPINNSQRSFALWQQTGRMLGVEPSTGNTFADIDLSAAEARRNAVSSVSNASNVVYAPNIVINSNGGSVNGEDIKKAVNNGYAEFKSFMDRYMKEQRRLSYA
jgi:phage-related minor tail protein